MKNEKCNILFAILFACVAAFFNLILALFANFMVIPLYFDSIFTIAIVSIFGFFPGIVCAFLSNLLVLFFLNIPFIFVFCHFLTVLFSWLFFNRAFVLKNYKYSFEAFLWVGFICGFANALLGNFISNIVFIDSKDVENTGILCQGIFVAINNLRVANYFSGIISNLVDKLLSAFISFFLYKYYMIVQLKLKK